MTKRRRQPFTSTLRALNVQPREALHVGDRLETDIAGAHAVGMYAALVLECSSQQEGIPHADLVLDSMADLPSALVEAQLIPRT